VINFEEQRLTGVELTPEQIDALYFLVHSEAYIRFYEPFLRGIERSLDLDLRDPSADRKAQKPDDYLRGGLMVVNALLSFPEEVLNEQRERELADQAQRTQEDHYAERAASGQMGPMGFSYRLRPEDDF
jgi:hypothetical protein